MNVKKDNFDVEMSENISILGKNDSFSSENDISPAVSSKFSTKSSDFQPVFSSFAAQPSSFSQKYSKNVSKSSNNIEQSLDSQNSKFIVFPEKNDEILEDFAVSTANSADFSSDLPQSEVDMLIQDGCASGVDKNGGDFSIKIDNPVENFNFSTFKNPTFSNFTAQNSKFEGENNKFIDKNMIFSGKNTVSPGNVLTGGICKSAVKSRRSDPFARLSRKQKEMGMMSNCQFRRGENQPLEIKSTFSSENKPIEYMNLGHKDPINMYFGCDNPCVGNFCEDPAVLSSEDKYCPLAEMSFEDCEMFKRYYSSMLSSSKENFVLKGQEFATVSLAWAQVVSEKVNRPLGKLPPHGSVQGILDSGASHHMTPCKDAFSSFTGAEVALKVADRVLETKALVGIFKPNSLGLGLGLWHPDLKVTLISVNCLEDRGDKILFVKKGRKIVTFAGTTHAVERVDKLPEVTVDFTVENMYMCVDNEAVAASVLAQRVHERAGHFWCSDNTSKSVRCSACDLSKSQGVGHKKEREVFYRPERFLDQVDWDFTGPWVKSLFGNTQLLSAIDEYTGWVENYPCNSRGQAPGKLQRFVDEVGRPNRVRSDNAKEFKEGNWKPVAAKQNPPITVTHSIQYEPQTNGVVERWNRTQSDAIRANMQGCDPRLWDWCSQYVAHTFNRLERRKGKCSPYKERHGRTANTSYFRRFGCLCFAKIHTHKLKLEDRFEPGIFLGYASNSTYRVGVWRADRRAAAGIRFDVIENRTVKFDEDIIVANVDDIRPGKSGLFVKFPLQGGLRESVQLEAKRVVPADLQPVGGAPAPMDALTPELPTEIGNSDEGTVINPRIVTGLDGVVRKRRGRPPGTKSQPHWRKPGRKPKTRDPVNEENVQGLLAASDEAAVKAEIDRLSRLSDEIAVAWTVQITRKHAFEGPDSDKWIEADSLERAQLEALRCWRPVKDGEFLPSDEIIPAVVIYTRKRCGRYKARLVALGNRQTQLSAAEVFSPTISHAANRYLVVESAAKGYHLEQFDISNAFIKAVLGDDRVFVRLPKHWSQNENKGDLVRLLRSLYGLKISPRRWYDTFRAELLSQGWEVCPKEPGLFRKGEMVLSVYVDDGLLSGPDPTAVRAERDRILRKLGGKVVPPEMGEGGVEIRDILGATLIYDRSNNYMKFSVSAGIDRCLKKFNMENCKSVVSPCVPSIPVNEGDPDTVFPIRSLVGSLQYFSCICRPDIAFAVQRIARNVHQPTENTIKAAKRILQYLQGTKEQGIEYSPQSERNFRAVYAEIAKKGDRKLPETVAFSDADFAGCSVTFKSTSGSIMYHRGTPITWSSKRQSIRATSTCEAEYVAMFDTIRMCESQGYLEWFLLHRTLPLVFSDNMSALMLAKNSLVTKKSKHMNLRFHKVRDHVEDLCFCPTNKNLADPLTKPLQGSKYLGIFGPSDSDVSPVETNDFVYAFYTVSC